MREFDLSINAEIPAGDVPVTVEQTASWAGLVAERGSLKMYPDSTHWHFRRPGSPGTLEATWFPGTERLWLSYHENRYAPWIDDAVEAFLGAFGEPATSA